MAMIEYQSNSELEQQEAMAAKEAQERQNRPEILSLSHYVMDCWQSAKEAKERKVEKKMIDALRARAGEYSPTKSQQIKQYGGSEVFMMLTDEKCTAVAAWMNDILFPPGDKPWGVKPTPVPDLEPGQMQEVKVAVMMEAQQTMKQQLVMEIQAGNIQNENQAKEWMLQQMQARAEELAGQIRDEMEEVAKEARDRIERKLDDVLVESNWQDAVMDAIDDIVTFPSGVVKGPVIRKKKVMRWKDQRQEQVMPGQEQFQEQDQSPVEVRTEAIIDFNRVSPLDIYPLPSAQTPEDGIIERHRLTRKYLTSLIGVEGYDDDAIRMVLTEYGQAGQSSWLSVANDLTRQELENRPNEWRSPDARIDALQFWGSVQGLMLLEYGMTPEQIEDPFADYSVEIWLIGRYVIKAEINGDPMGKVPYHFASFRKRNGSLWGSGVPEVISDCQDAVNAAARSLINNMAISCLTGDTVVYRHGKNGRKYSELTLDELWEKKADHNSGLRRIKIRSLDEQTGGFFLNRIHDIFDNGEAPVYEVVTKKGYKIKATGNHRFMSSDGEWKFLDCFFEGDDIAVNGAAAILPANCVDCGSPLSKKTAKRCRTCASSSEHSHWNKQQIIMARGNRSALATSSRQRKECRDAAKEFCEKCGVGVEHRLEVHHKDRDPYNNDRGNLITLCDFCHKYEHRRHDNFGDAYKHKFVDYDEIIQIKYVGVERVYDLSMEGPNHNFVANGFISHNSGPQVMYDISQLPAGESLTDMYPMKIWQINGQAAIGNGTRAPIQFFMPPSVAGPLMEVYKFFSEEADNKTGVPKYSYGGEAKGGALGTATGFTMMMNNAARGIKQVVRNVDKGIIAPSIIKTHEFQLLYFKDPDYYTGDIKLIAKGSSALVQKEQAQIRRNELLNVVLSRPAALEVVQLTGLAQMLREIFKGADFKSDDIVPTKEQLEMRMQQAVIQQQQIEAETGKETDGAGNKQSGKDFQIV